MRNDDYDTTLTVLENACRSLRLAQNSFDPEGRVSLLQSVVTDLSTASDQVCVLLGTVGKDPVLSVLPNGNREWRRNGQLHREDGPAVESPHGVTEWYYNGQRHRVGGPAVETPAGTHVWYFCGEYHREDGPAIESSKGYKAWYRNGIRHREDGPAVLYENGVCEWWIDGELVPQREGLT